MFKFDFILCNMDVVIEALSPYLYQDVLNIVLSYIFVTVTKTMGNRTHVYESMFDIAHGDYKIYRANGDLYYHCKKYNGVTVCVHKAKPVRVRKKSRSPSRRMKELRRRSRKKSRSRKRSRKRSRSRRR